MRMVLLAGGRMRPGPLADLYRDYARRLRPALELVEAEAKPQARDPAAEEGVRLGAALPPGARLIALDRDGQMLDSPGLARLIADTEMSGAPALAFLIGGAEGIAPGLKAQASGVIAFGRVTWPHLLLRVMLAEQIWRAQAIRTGHPYHRD